MFTFVPCAQASAESVATWKPYINEASRLFGIPEAWIVRVMRAESAGRTHRDGHPIRSSAGAMGLMQLMPGTWAEMRARLRLSGAPDDPRDNILAGTYYLRLLYDRFGYPGMFAAYNAGPRRYQEHLERGRGMPRERRRYLARLVRLNEHPLAIVVAQPRISMFAIGRSEVLAEDLKSPRRILRNTDASLFALRRGL
jgi:soluble lytic murein transglycosylase-like protein